MRRAVATLTALLLVLLSPVGLFTQVASAQNYSSPVNPYAQSNPYGRQQQAVSAQPYAGQSYAGQDRYSGQYTDQAYGGSPQVGQAFTPQQLEEMVAPIALYPDTLIAQILAAATYPAQVSAADQWLRAQGPAPAEQIAAGASAQTAWDPSIKALTAFPQVLAMMDRNLNWTTDLGNAYYNQPQDVLATIQAMRQRAQNAGTLQSTPQEEVTNNQGYIQLAPANPQVVYVPTYNPWSVYGQPVSPYPGFSLLGAIESFMGSAPIRYGLGTGMSSFMGTNFGWLGWALDWLSSNVLFHHSNYYSQSTSVAHWNTPHRGSYNYGQREGYGTRQTTGSYRSQEAFNRPANGTAAPGFDRYGYRQGENYAGNRPYENRLTEPSARAWAGNAGRPAAPYTMERGQAQAPMPARQQYYSRPENYGSSQQAWAERPSTPYASPRQNGSAPAYSQPRGYSSGPSYYENRQNFASEGRAYAEKAPKHESSGGFHLFGGGHEGSSYHAPKPPKAPKSISGGKHSGGGLFGGHHSDKHHR
jgi:hypothetical protein